MTGKAKKGAPASKGKKASAGVAPKAKPRLDQANAVVEVPEEQKVSAAAEVKVAPPPAATQDVDHREEAGQQPESKPSEAEAEAIAEQLVAEARKPLKKNDSQSSLAGSVTVGAAAAAVCSCVTSGRGSSWQACQHIKSSPVNTSQLVIASILPLQETELDRFQVPEDAAAEEDNLRAARESKEKQKIKVRTVASDVIWMCRSIRSCHVCMQS